MSKLELRVGLSLKLYVVNFASGYAVEPIVPYFTRKDYQTSRLEVKIFSYTLWRLEMHG